MAGEGAPGRGMKERVAEGAPFGWYLRHRHELIRRHAEVFEQYPDHTAKWELRIDLELPTDLEPWGDQNEEAFFPFPLVFLKKIEGRREFSILDESGKAVQVPIRAECDDFSTAGLLHAANALIGEVDPQIPDLDDEELAELEDSFRLIVAEKPYQASMVLAKLRRRFGLVDENGGDQGWLDDIGKLWRKKGLDEVLQMLVEHSLIWVPLQGRPGQRRSLLVCERKEFHRRPFVRWAFGELRPKWNRPGVERRHRRALDEIAEAKEAKKIPDPREAVAIGGRPYGRRKRTISFSALGERIGQPLAWMPSEYRLATIYAMRCASYHFEFRCSPGRTPRDLRMATGPSLAERESNRATEREMPPGTRRTLTSSVARVDLKPPQEGGPDLPGKDLFFRITVGIGNNNFPVLWFLASAITAVMLWILADTEPSFITDPTSADLAGTNAQILAGILLVVPALVSALAVGSNDVPVTQLIGGARILLLVTGLSAVAAAAVVAGARPWDISAESAWALCAMVATAATIPLGASWLLSSPQVWGWLMGLDSRRKQRRSLARLIGCALIGITCLIALPDDGAEVTRGVLAVYLFALAVMASVVGNDRAAMRVDQSRHYITVSFLAVGMTCMALAFLELRGAIDEPARLQTEAELIAAALLPLLYFLGGAIYGVTQWKWFAPAPDEVHISPLVGEAMLRGERVLEFMVLREREDLVKNVPNQAPGPT